MKREFLIGPLKIPVLLFTSLEDSHHNHGLFRIKPFYLYNNIAGTLEAWQALEPNHSNTHFSSHNSALQKILS